MSADNWTVCPKCTKTEKDLADQYRQKVANNYGKISESEYLKLKSQEYLKPDAETLREDYEVYMDEKGEFTIYYSCSCDKCGFRFEHNHQEQVLEK